MHAKGADTETRRLAALRQPAVLRPPADKGHDAAPVRTCARRPVELANAHALRPAGLVRATSGDSEKPGRFGP